MKKALLLFFVSTVAFGSGYEKSVLWGGKYSGVAGSAAAGVTGSDSIFYNPAGLVNSPELGDITFNLSSGSAQFKGPIVPKANPLMAPATPPGTPTGSTTFTRANVQESSKTSSTVVPGVTYSMKLNDSWSYGLGYYAVGGTRAIYEDVDFAPRNFKAKIGSEITISEFSAGVGYKVSDAMRLGLGLRYTMTDASFSSVGYGMGSAPFGSTVAAITNVDIKDIKTANLDGVRLGMQYDVSENTKLGLVIRTETKVSKTAKASGVVNSCGASCQTITTHAIPEADVKVDTVLPMAINLGVEHKLTDTWTLFGELVHTQYSKIEKVDLDGTILVTAGGTTTDTPIPDIDQKWKDQLNVKLAAQYSGMSWPVRFGYIHTSDVSNKQYARASFTPPGAAATYTLGTGQEFKIGESPLDFNIAIDYTTVKGDSDDSVQPLYTPAGSYEASSTAIHTGFAYKF